MVSDATLIRTWCLIPSIPLEWHRMPSHSCKIKAYQGVYFELEVFEAETQSELHLGRRGSVFFSSSILISEVTYFQIVFRDVIFVMLIICASVSVSAAPRLLLQSKTRTVSQVTDAKSLYDALIKQRAYSRQDRHTAVELAIIVESMRKSSSTLPTNVGRHQLL